LLEIVRESPLEMLKVLFIIPLGRPTPISFNSGFIFEKYTYKIKKKRIYNE